MQAPSALGQLPAPVKPRSRSAASVPASPDGAPEDGVPVNLHGQPYLCIREVDQMPPFLMSVVSDSDFWLFVGSNGGFTAGRSDPDHAIFPYQTADKILAQPRASGVLSILQVDGVSWEPWTAECPGPGITRNLYKHVTGTSVIFEEIHGSLNLVFRAELAISERFGLVRNCSLENLANHARTIRLLDGWQHLLPSGVTQETYSRYSYLAAAYMRHEVDSQTQMGIYTLNSGITDRAEPSESLRVSCAWSLGLEQALVLLSDRQVDAFRRGLRLEPETEARGVFGSHLLVSQIVLQAQETKSWYLVADTGLDHTEVSRLHESLLKPEILSRELSASFSAGVLALKRRIAGAGAIQQSADAGACIHHFANVLFNCMRGGTLHDNYSFPRSDFLDFLRTRNAEISQRHWASLVNLPEACSLAQISEYAAASGDPQLARLAGEYLPICFSRRHGDPSRPWNRFEIRTKDTAGKPLFAYAGNWRDIFQNWESLAYSYPLCFESMIAIFLNASTADGYNPYRITRAGIDWEVYDAGDPWSHIGYWGDHQIIYLLRLLEGQERFYPGQITARLNERAHSYASVPYEICGFDEMLHDPKHSIQFNQALHETLMERATSLGGDGKLLAGSDGQVILVTLAEKLLVPLLVKLSNLVPGGGIWLNTQRPEWNDANNALAGWGLSVVTVCHLRRYLAFIANLFDGRASGEFLLSEPVAELLDQINQILPKAAVRGLDDAARYEIMCGLGLAGEKHRQAVYQRREMAVRPVSLQDVREFIRHALAAVDETVSANLRSDGLFHSYNLLEIKGKTAIVQTLDLMLEGQVAALSSGTLTPSAALRLLVGMRGSPLYREDQNSYLLYPDRTITPFMQRNVLPDAWQGKVPQLATALEQDGHGLIRVDDKGAAHFHSDLTNTRDLIARLDAMQAIPEFHEAVHADRAAVLELWEEVFHHRSFTGRSGAMFAFEGLGSIYWHMVAKLLLALQEVYFQSLAVNGDSSETGELAAIYDEVRNGLGFTKDSQVYGAFPTDPYSHSPRHRGAQQPGMTGQVKEEILTRMGELGVHIHHGCVLFDPVLLKRHEFFTKPHTFESIDLSGAPQTWQLQAGTLAFTLFQVPVCYVLGQSASIALEFSDGRSALIEGRVLPVKESHELFERSGLIRSIRVTLPKNQTSISQNP